MSIFHLEITAKEQLMSTKSHTDMALKQYQSELFQADLAKKLAESVLKSVTLKLKDKKTEVLALKTSGSAKIISSQDNNGKAAPDTFLASEGLASAKKQSSVSPVKPKKPKKRNLSVSKPK